MASLAGSFANFAVKAFDLRLELLTAKESAKDAKLKCAPAVIENFPAGETVFAELLAIHRVTKPHRRFPKSIALLRLCFYNR